MIGRLLPQHETTFRCPVRARTKVVLKSTNSLRCLAGVQQKGVQIQLDRVYREDSGRGQLMRLDAMPPRHQVDAAATIFVSKHEDLPRTGGGSWILGWGWFLCHQSSRSTGRPTPIASIVLSTRWRRLEGIKP